MSALEHSAVDNSGAPIVEPGVFVTRSGEGTARLNLMVENLHCAGCIRKIEGALGAVPGVVSARVNMSTRRLVVDWREGAVEPRTLMGKVRDLGYPVAPFNPLELHDAAAREGRRLLTALAVAGFAAGNVMLLSVSVWAGLDGSMGIGTRGLFHWISALIALPAIAYAGRPFFRSAFAALRSRALNMDVPISLGVLLAAAMSLYQTIVGGPHAYFDAALMLLFFLLIGRYLDHRARAKARSVAEHLMTLSATAARVVAEDGTERLIPASELEPGMIVALNAGDRVPADGIVVEGRSELDTSLVTGETLPAATGPGERIFTDALRPDARATVDALRAQGLAIELLSGDREAVVRAVAAELGIADWRAGCLPAEKAARLEELAAQGRKVLMVGDGLNDAPSLAAGFASISPASAADISQTAADLIFQGARLAPVTNAIRVARRARRLVAQNFGLAAAYNIVAVPIAVAGLVTPLIAAVAMSSSSILVTLNALRLRWAR